MSKNKPTKEILQWFKVLPAGTDIYAIFNQNQKQQNLCSRQSNRTKMNQQNTEPINLRIKTDINICNILRT